MSLMKRQRHYSNRLEGLCLCFSVSLFVYWSAIWIWIQSDSSHAESENGHQQGLLSTNCAGQTTAARAITTHWLSWQCPKMAVPPMVTGGWLQRLLYSRNKHVYSMVQKTDLSIYQIYPLTTIALQLHFYIFHFKFILRCKLKYVIGGMSDG